MARKILIKVKEHLRLKSLGEKPRKSYVVRAWENGEGLINKTFNSMKKAKSFVESTKRRWKRMGKR